MFTHTVLAYQLKPGQQTFPLKIQIVNSLGFAANTISFPTTQVYYGIA